MIALVHTLVKCPAIGLKHCLVLAPLNAVLNWVYEWHKWLDKRNQLKVRLFLAHLLGHSCLSALTLLVGSQKEHPARKNLTDEVLSWLERSANSFHMVQLMPVPPHHLCFSKIQNGLSFCYRLTLVVPDKRS